METFKQALSETMRAIAERKELQVTFSSSLPLLKNKSSLVPLPTTAFTAAEIARSRGAADAYAACVITMKGFTNTSNRIRVRHCPSSKPARMRAWR